MTMQAREGTQSLRSAVRISESICALPAVATQDWCDRAAAALLPVGQPSVAVALIGQVDENGAILRHEATGVAGCYIAEVTTTIGRSQSATSVLPLDPNDTNLIRVRTMMAQARELGWTPGRLETGATRAGSFDRVAGNAAGGHSATAALMRRWESIRYSGLLLGAASIGPQGRVLIVEVALTGSPTAQTLESEVAVLDAVLPSLARRTIMAIGSDPTDGTTWLTQREQIILQHLLLGKSVREIADELGRSPHTVHDHVKSLHRKLKANSRGELVARALGYNELLHPAAEDGRPGPLQADVITRPQAQEPPVPEVR